MESHYISHATKLVAVLLALSILYPGITSIVYHDGVSHTVYHESDESFDSAVNGSDLDTSNATAVSDLSGATQKAFYEAKSNIDETNTSYTLDSIQICQPGLVVCDEYRWPLNFPYDGGSGYAAEGLVEEDGEFYLVSKFNGPWGGPMIPVYIIVITIVKLAFLGPYSLFLYVINKPEQTPFTKYEVAAFTGYGGLVFAALATYPYLVMFDYLPQGTVEAIPTLELGLVMYTPMALGIAVAIFRYILQYVRERKPASTHSRDD